MRGPRRRERRYGETHPTPMTPILLTTQSVICKQGQWEAGDKLERLAGRSRDMGAKTIGREQVLPPELDD